MEPSDLAIGSTDHHDDLLLDLRHREPTLVDPRDPIPDQAGGSLAFALGQPLADGVEETGLGEESVVRITSSSP